MASPSALVCGARQALLAALSCSGLWGCLGDTGELFPEMASSAPEVTSPPEVLAGPGDTSSESQPADGAVLADAPAAGETPEAPAASGRSEPEQPGPIELDPGTSDDGGGSSEAPAPVDTATQPSGPAPSEEATPPSEESPAEASPPLVSGATDIAQVCAGIADPLLLDFTSPGDDPTQALFGDFRDVLSGGTYVYPSVGEATPAAGLASDVTSGDWHISGSVAQQAGFGLFLDCQLLDASRFTGLAFRISGQGAGSLTLLIGTASNDVSSAWLVANDATSPPSSGRCTPARDVYDGTCSQARIEIPVSPQAREVLVPFSALAQGSPEAGVNPAEITTIGWALPSPALNRLGNANAYDVDLRIDDIRFIEGAIAPSAPAP